MYTHGGGSYFLIYAPRRLPGVSSGWVLMLIALLLTLTLTLLLLALPLQCVSCLYILRV